jgi:hypothetical protein
LHLERQGWLLRLYDPKTATWLATPPEDRLAREQAQAERNQEKAAREQAQAERNLEKAARQQAEAEIDRLRREIDHLRGGSSSEPRPRPK